MSYTNMNVNGSAALSLLKMGSQTSSPVPDFQLGRVNISSEAILNAVNDVFANNEDLQQQYKEQFAELAKTTSAENAKHNATVEVI